MAAVTLDQAQAPPDRAAFWRIAALLCGSAIIGTFLGAITGEKTLFLEKETLHLTPGTIGTLNLIVGIPAYLRPFAGATADLFPLFGYHRRSYYLLAALVEIAAFSGLAFLHQYHYVPFVCFSLIVAAGGVLAGVMVSAVMVAVGNRTGRFGQLQSLLVLLPYVMSIAGTAHFGGYVAQHWTYQHVFSAAALLVLLRSSLVFLLDDRRVTSGRHAHETEEEHAARLAARREDRDRTRAALREAARSPGLWAIVGFVFYLIITPGIYTAQVFYMTDVLHLSKQFIGNLGLFTAAGALIALGLFTLASRRMPVAALVWGAWLMDCLGYPVLLLLHDAPSARILSLFGGCIGILYGLCLNTLAARASPPGIEGTVYGLVLSAIAFAGVLSEKIGGTLYDYFGPSHHHSIIHAWQMSLWVGLGFTLVGFVFIPFLPAWAKSRAPLRSPVPPGEATPEPAST